MIEKKKTFQTFRPHSKYQEKIAVRTTTKKITKMATLKVKHSTKKSPVLLLFVVIFWTAQANTVSGRCSESDLNEAQRAFR